MPDSPRGGSLLCCVKDVMVVGVMSWKRTENVAGVVCFINSVTLLGGENLILNTLQACVIMLLDPRLCKSLPLFAQSSLVGREENNECTMGI